MRRRAPGADRYPGDAERLQHRQHRHVPGFVQDQRGGGVPQDRLQLVGGVVGVQRNDLRTGRLDGEGGDADVQRIAQQQGDPAGVAAPLKFVREGGNTGGIALVAQPLLAANERRVAAARLGRRGQHVDDGRVAPFRGRITQ